MSRRAGSSGRTCADVDAVGPPMERALRYVAAVAGAGGPVSDALRVTMHFHPDRMAGDLPILDRMAEDGVYRSQFVTGTGNGGLTAYPGGDRWRWESRMFGGAYDAAAAEERPVYGALDYRRDPRGGARRFGSSFFRLTAETLARTTFCYPDSSTEPTSFATAERCGFVEPAEAGGLDPLDCHIEAHVHGPVVLARDIEALVLDPSYAGTPVEAAARRLPCAVEWHPGYRLPVDVLCRWPEFRGRRFVELGLELAVDGHLDARVLGDAARSGRYDPQDLKKVWHYIARFGGEPAR
ncbi:DUF3626 domain-containing protein [Streptomyces sp. NPDC060194]|uniref:DUF3626 domain-containing protein n=1 Tax=Streptomyces sp. NPDC060194 TaxID=3347069 RepID=UPI0036547365